MKPGISRRDFMKRSGIGLGGFLAAPALLAQSFKEDWQAGEAVEFAVNHALEKGAAYCDARIGICHIEGIQQAFTPLSLFRSELLGIRLGAAGGWKFLLINDFSEQQIRESIDQALTQEASPKAQSDLKVWASFDPHKNLAFKSSDPETEEMLSFAWMRYQQQQGFRSSNRHLLYCDILSDQ